MNDIAPLLTALQGWAKAQPDVLGLALVGSYARGEAEPHTDVDLLVLTTSSGAYRKDSGWLNTIDWPMGAGPEASWEDVDYGLVWSRHLHLADGTLLELGFAEPTWADTTLVDSATRAVVRGGCRILWDPKGLIGRMVRAVAEQST